MVDMVMDLRSITELRRSLLANGYAVVPVKSRQKVPSGFAWQTVARKRELPTTAAAALNTGILCDGLRVIDIDIDDIDIADAVAKLANDFLGIAPARTRGNSGRKTLVYRAEDGEPKKRIINGSAGKVEVLGYGQQFVAFGTHPSGAEFDWPTGSLQTIAMADLSAITEAELSQFLEASASIIGAKTDPLPRPAAPPRQFETGSTSELEFLLSYVNAGCGYEDWVRVLMAIHDVTGGSEEGLSIADRWSAGAANYSGSRAIESKWRGFTTGGGMTIATIAHLAEQGGADLAEVARRYDRDAYFTDTTSPEDLREQAEQSRLLRDFFDRKDQKRAEAEAARSATELEWFDHIQPVVQTPYIIKGLLDQGAMSVVYGPSNSGKTFFTLDVAYHIAVDAQWRERRVRGGSVLYLAAEGGNGIANRIAALRKTHGVLDVPFALRRAGLDLLKPQADVKKVIALAAEVAKVAPVALIVIDTLSRVIAGGDENAATDMTAFIKNVDTIKIATGAHILIVHHTGKDAAKGARGHSSLRAATDTEIELVTDEFNNRFAKVTKQRDHEGGEEFAFSLKPIHLGQDQDGDNVSTCIVEPVETKEKQSGFDIPPMVTCKAILEDIQLAWNGGNPYSMTTQSQRTGRYAPRALAEKFRFKEASIDRLLKSWLDNEIIIMGTFDQRNSRKGLSVIGHLG